MHQGAPRWVWAELCLSVKEGRNEAAIQSTDAVVTLDKEGKIKARVWEGVSENGVPFVLYVAYTQVRSVEDVGEFERDLVEHKAPDIATQRAIDARMIL